MAVRTSSQETDEHWELWAQRMDSTIYRIWKSLLRVPKLREEENSNNVAFDQMGNYYPIQWEKKDT